MNAAGSNVSSTLAASWAGWAVSSLASKFYRTKTSPDPKSTSAQTSINTNKENVEKNKSDNERTPSIQKSESGNSAAEFDEEVWGSIDADNTPTDTKRKSLDGWDDDWNDDPLDDNQNTSEEQNIKTNNRVKAEDEDFFDKFTEQTNTNPVFRLKIGPKVKESELIRAKAMIRLLPQIVI